MNTKTRHGFRIYLDGHYTCTIVWGWKNLREYTARQEAKGHVVSYTFV